VEKSRRIRLAMAVLLVSALPRDRVCAEGAYLQGAPFIAKSFSFSGTCWACTSAAYGSVYRRASARSPGNRLSRASTPASHASSTARESTSRHSRCIRRRWVSTRRAA